jgi:predicted transcriptional regulator
LPAGFYSCLIRSVDTPRLRPYTAIMEVHLTPEQQHQLAELATQRGRDADALAQEAISRYLAEEARFVEAVKLGEEALQRGEYLTHEQVGKRLNRLFQR